MSLCLSDEYIYELVMSQPVPERLVRSILRAPDLTNYRTQSRISRARGQGCSSLDPKDMNENLRRALDLICRGHSNREIAAMEIYSLHTVQSWVQALLAIFGARNRSHLCALAVAQGYVDMEMAA